MFVDILSEVSDCCDVVVHLIVLARDKQACDLMQNDSSWHHQLRLVCLGSHLLTLTQIEAIYHLYGDVDRFTCLSKFNAHLVDAIYDSFSTLNTTKRLFNHDAEQKL